MRRMEEREKKIWELRVEESQRECVLAHFVSRLERRALVMVTASVLFQVLARRLETVFVSFRSKEWGIFKGEFFCICAQSSLRFFRSFSSFSSCGLSPTCLSLFSYANEILWPRLPR